MEPRYDSTLHDEFRRRLLEAREGLLRTVASSEDKMADLEAPAPGDSPDHAALRSMATLLSRLAGQEKRELEEVSAALRRLGAGAFGVCVTWPGAHRARAPAGGAGDALLHAVPGQPGGGSVIGRLALLMVLLAGGVEAQDRGALVARGRSVFQDQGCYGCHKVGAAGTPIATDLSRIGAKHDEAYFGRWLRDPAQQKPRAHMAKLQLTDAEVEALAAYLGSLR